MVRGVVGVADDGWFTVLRSERPIDVEAGEPSSRSIQQLPRVLLVLGLLADWQV